MRIKNITNFKKQNCNTLNTINIRKISVQDHHPIEQGLRHVCCETYLDYVPVQDHHPIEQGLRREEMLWKTWNLRSPRPSSNRTRIKTSGGCFPKQPERDCPRPSSNRTRIKTKATALLPGPVEQVQDHHPIEQGLRHGSRDTVKIKIVSSKTIIQ